MNAEFTNALSNGLHALALFIYFSAARRARNRGEERFTRSVVGFFFLLFLLKVLGVYVHYDPESPAVKVAWTVVGVGVILMHYLLLKILGFALRWRLAGVAFAIACSVPSFVWYNFDFLAVEILVFHLVAAFASQGLLRLGFLGVVGSALFWIVARKGTEAWIGHELSTEYRYDNDLFHFLLIASTFIVYKAFAKGEGLPHWKCKLGAS